MHMLEVAHALTSSETLFHPFSHQIGIKIAKKTDTAYGLYTGLSRHIELGDICRPCNFYM